MLKREDLNLLRQLVSAMEEARMKLENYYQMNDVDNFNKAKKLILQIQKMIAEVIR
jgi:hypothetical protein